MKLSIGSAVAFNERPWEMNGSSGVTRKVTVAGGGFTDVFKFPEDMWNRLSPDVRQHLATCNAANLGSRIVVEFTIFRGDRSTDLLVQGLAIWDRDGNFVFSNLPEAAEAVLGASA